MNEFDPCPGCKVDLLLEDPSSEGKRLHCLECGYSCEATSPQDENSTAFFQNKLNSQLNYWKQRCQAAESVIEGIITKNEEMYFSSHQAWLEIKEEGEPT